MPKNTGLKLFTKSWPPKRETKEEASRPSTATLDEPTILNVKLITVVDMSTVRKEFLNISNLCRFNPFTFPIAKTQSCSQVEKLKIEDDKSKAIKGGVSIKKRVSELNKVSDSNNNKSFKVPRSRVRNIVKLLELKGAAALEKSTKLLIPEPCKTCGRPNQPERFHSHPDTPIKLTKKAEEPTKMLKSTVQKPIAMKYKSKQTTINKNKSSATIQPSISVRKSSLPAQKLVHTPPPQNARNSNNTNISNTSRPTSAKPTLTCYLCGREFGSASLPLHEPKCLQKWERENESLPIHLRRNPPPKPDHPLSQEEWNQFAWESSQASLIPCSNCGRTFYPDRLMVHQNSCKSPQKDSKLPVDKSQTNSTSSPSTSSSCSSVRSTMSPPSVECYICGKMFGTHSIKIHERQCLRKWHVENDLLPKDIRAPEPIRKDTTKPEKKPDQAMSSSPRTSTDAESSGQKSPLFPCYLCGKLFSVNSIYVHEPQCLKVWKMENEKLPPHKRKPEPLKPDVKFTPTGDVDFKGTFHRIWENHMAELVACEKCGRKFFPDRIEKHRAACAGLRIQIKNKK